MGKKTKKLGKGKKKAAEAEEKRARRETRSSHLRMTSMPLLGKGGRVVDKGYRLLGIDFLRVIDGSTFYQTPGANPQATVMMLGRQEMSLMVKYGLRPGTLKGELFGVLLERGIHGLKDSELAKSLQISELNLPSGIEELESLIGSTLSSDITLFENISSSTYRVRINSSEKKVEESQLDTEDPRAVDDDLGDSGTCSSDDDSGCNSGNSKMKKLTYMNHGKSKDNVVIVYTKIDEGHAGKVWLLGLMEGEYSDLSIEERLSAIVAPIDLLHAGSSF
ncbi:unnamed protein product [Prunus armeniaca]